MERVYLIHLEMPGADVRRLAETMPLLLEVLKRLGKFDRLYNCPQGDLIGFMVRTSKVAGQIKAAMESGPKGKGSALRNGDKFMILEVGQDFYWRSMGVIDAYLRHRAAPQAKESNG